MVLVFHFLPATLMSLLPETLIVILKRGNIFPDLQSFWARHRAAGGASTYVRSSSNLVFITEPSRTADIEQVTTLGVHGPRELIVVVHA